MRNWFTLLFQPRRDLARQLTMVGIMPWVAQMSEFVRKCRHDRAALDRLPRLPDTMHSNVDGGIAGARFSGRPTDPVFRGPTGHRLEY